MSRLDSFAIADSTGTNATGTGASNALSLEGNPGPKASDASATSEATKGRDRGHYAHAGGENTSPHHGLSPHTVTPETPGIDVSEFNGTVNWSDVAKAGEKFAYVRATDGTTIQDANFQQNFNGAEAAGIPVGAYHYLTTTSSVADQIKNFSDTISKVDAGNLPPMVDVEDPTQWAKLSVPDRVSTIQQMLDGVEKATGQQPILYMSSDFSAQELGGTAQFDKYKLFVADYTTAAQPDLPPTFTNWNFWQHSDTGAVSGITGKVDLDYFNGSESQLPLTHPVKAAAQPGTDNTSGK